MVAIQAGHLQTFVHDLLSEAGAPADIAEQVAAHLVRANLSGHDSHGVIRVPQYVKRIESGELIPDARPQIIRAGELTATIDGARGFGHVAVGFALRWAMDGARQHGVACAVVRHCTHMGRLGEFTERAAAEGFLSILTVGAAGPGVGGMLPFGGVERFFGANPWSFSVPGGPAGDVVVDVSSSTAAEGKVRLALARGDQLPVGIVTGSDGQPTTDPHAFSGGGLAPLGGDVAGHKGMGFALASALFGALAMIGDPDPTLIGASVQSAHEGSAGQLAGVFLIVIDPSAFGDPEEYVRLVSTTLTALRAVPPAPRVERVLVPGEPEAQARRLRSQHGLQLPEQIWSDMVGLAKRYGVGIPTVTSSEPSVKA